MSTKSSYGLYEGDGLTIHVYHEMKDSCAHMEIEQDQLYVDVILPQELALAVAAAVERIPEASPSDSASGGSEGPLPSITQKEAGE